MAEGCQEVHGGGSIHAADSHCCVGQHAAVQQNTMKQLSSKFFKRANRKYQCILKNNSPFWIRLTVSLKNSTRYVWCTLTQLQSTAGSYMNMEQYQSENTDTSIVYGIYSDCTQFCMLSYVYVCMYSFMQFYDMYILCNNHQKKNFLMLSFRITHLF